MAQDGGVAFSRADDAIEMFHDFEAFIFHLLKCGNSLRESSFMIIGDRIFPGFMKAGVGTFHIAKSSEF